MFIIVDFCFLGKLSLLVGVSLAYGRDDIESWSGVCIILTSRIGQRSETEDNENENENQNENF